LTAGQPEDPPVRDSASLAGQRLPPALMQVAHGPNIRRAPERGDLQGQVARQHLAHGPDLARAQDSARGQVSLEHGLAQAAHLRPAKLRARNAQVLAAVDAASNSIRRQKKAR
jgi:hypothetical protein